MSWEEDFRRNIERTRQRIMEIAPDMLDLSAHRAARNAHAANNTPHLDGLGPSAPTQPPRRDGERAATYPQRDALLLNMSRQLCAVDDSEMPSFEEQVAETSLIVPSRTFEEEINLYAKILVEKAKYSSREVDNAIATLVKVRTKDFARHHSLSNATALLATPARPASAFPQGVNVYPIHSRRKWQEQRNGKTYYHYEGTALYDLAPVILDVGYYSFVLATTMHIGPAHEYNSDTDYSDHPIMQCLAFSRSIRGCDVRLVYQSGFRANPGEHFSATAATAAEEFLKKMGVAVRKTSPTVLGPLAANGSHCKFILVGEYLGNGGHSVIAQSSANFYDGDARWFQDSLVSRNDAAIFHAYLKAFALLWKVATPVEPGFKIAYARSGGREAYFMPSIPQSKTLNPFVYVLWRLQPGPGSYIRMAMAFQADATPESKQFYSILEWHAEKGTHVEMVGLPAAYGQMKHLHDNFPSIQGRTVASHAKFLLAAGPMIQNDTFNPFISSDWEISQGKRILSGSKNLDQWEQCDSVMVVDPDREGATDAWVMYNAFFNEIWAAGTAVK